MKQPPSQPKRGNGQRGLGAATAEIDPELVDRLAAIHCTVDEIASVCDVSYDTIVRRFHGKIEAGKLKGRASLRRAQWKAAEAGNPALLIWLGKQLLGQTDKLPDFTRLSDEELLRIAAGAAPRLAGMGETATGAAGVGDTDEQLN